MKMVNLSLAKHQQEENRRPIEDQVWKKQEYEKKYLYIYRVSNNYRAMEKFNMVETGRKSVFRKKVESVNKKKTFNSKYMFFW